MVDKKEYAKVLKLISEQIVAFKTTLESSTEMQSLKGIVIKSVLKENKIFNEILRNRSLRKKIISDLNNKFGESCITEILNNIK